MFARSFEAGEPVALKGSDTWEGVYFVFVELLAARASAAESADGGAGEVAEPGGLGPEAIVQADA